MKKVAMFTFCSTLLGASGSSFAQELVIDRVTLQVRDGQRWVPSTGRLYQLIDGVRKLVAEVGEDGKLDAAITCRAGDRFEAEAASPLDRPSPPPRIGCAEKLAFKYVRAVYVQLSGGGLMTKSSVAVAPRVFSELTVRSSMAGSETAAVAFSDAAIYSTAVLLGDVKQDQLVARDPTQGFRLVFTPAGIEALKSKQRDAGLRESGILDAATQSVFAAEVGTRGQLRMTPAVKCAARDGQLVCTDGEVGGQSKAAVAVPAFEIRN